MADYQWTLDGIQDFLRSVFPVASVYLVEDTSYVEAEPTLPSVETILGEAPPDEPPAADQSSVIDDAVADIQLNSMQGFDRLPAVLPDQVWAELLVVHGMDTLGNHALVPWDYDTRYDMPREWSEADEQAFVRRAAVWDVFGDPPIHFVPSSERIDVDWAQSAVLNHFPAAEFVEIGDYKLLRLFLGVFAESTGVQPIPSELLDLISPGSFPDYFDTEAWTERTAELRSTLDDAAVEYLSSAPWDQALSTLLQGGTPDIEPDQVDTNDSETLTISDLISLIIDAAEDAAEVLTQTSSDAAGLAERLASLGSQARSQLPFLISLVDGYQSVEQLIAGGESEVVEFKSTARFNLEAKKRTASIEDAVVKTLAAFANSRGGTLLIGVADDGEVLGLENDLQLFAGASRDRYQLWIQRHLSDALGMEALFGIRIGFSGEVLRIDVQPGAKATFAVMSGGSEEYFVRVGNQTQKLSRSEQDTHSRSRFPRSEPL